MSMYKVYVYIKCDLFEAIHWQSIKYVYMWVMRELQSLWLWCFCGVSLSSCELFMLRWVGGAQLSRKSKSTISSKWYVYVYILFVWGGGGGDCVCVCEYNRKGVSSAGCVSIANTKHINKLNVLSVLMTYLFIFNIIYREHDYLWNTNIKDSSKKIYCFFCFFESFARYLIVKQNLMQHKYNY